MAFVKPVDGVYTLDPNEPPVAQWELDRAKDLLAEWHKGHLFIGTPTTIHSPCPHQDDPCTSRRMCLGKIAWWRRYMVEIDTERIERGLPELGL